MSDQVFLNLGAVAAWLALAVFVLALFSDFFVQRFRKRRRCPRCWYSMQGTPGLRCSECGYEANRERTLFKSRKRWRVVWLAVFLLAGSYALRVMPGVKDRGWVAAVPTTALIVSMPWHDVYDENWKYKRIPQPDVTVWNKCAAELLDERVKPAVLWHWQEELLVNRCLQGDVDREPLSFEWKRVYGKALDQLQGKQAHSELWWHEDASQLVDMFFESRAVWLAGEPVYGTYYLRRWDTSVNTHVNARPVNAGGQTLDDFESAAGTFWCGGTMGSAWTDRLQVFGTFPQAAEHLVYDIEATTYTGYTPDSGRRPLRQYQIALPIRITDDVNDLGMTAVDNDETTEAIRQCVHPYVRGPDRGALLLYLWDDGRVRQSVYSEPPPFSETQLAAIAPLVDVTMGVSFVLRCDNKVIASDKVWATLRHSDASWYLSPAGPIVMRAYDREDCDFTSENWTVTLKSDLPTALRDLKSTRYWAGEITLPVEVR